MTLQGESFDVSGIKETDQQEIKMTNEEINEKYLRGEIRIVTEQARYPLDTISSLLSSSKYDLNPEYQRRKRWKVEQQSRLIESFIINVPIPPIFLYEVEYAKYEVMDGLQRLTAIDDFYSGRFTLTGLEEWKELNGKSYNDLPQKIKEGIDRRYLSSVVLLNETAKTQEEAEFLKQIVFGRLNSGGDKLTAQESRNALYGGPFNSFCIELSKNENFRKLWQLPLIEVKDGVIINEPILLDSEAYRKMEDVELVLRFFAYRHFEKLSFFRTQERFLDHFLLQANNFSEETKNQLRTIFEKTVSLIYQIFGEEAFYMPDGTQKRTTPTKTIYDPLMYSVSHLLEYEELLYNKREELKKNKFKDKNKLIIPGKEKNNELFDGKYQSRVNVEDRITYFNKYFKTILDI